MSEVDEWVELKNTLKFYVIWGVHILIDTLFLALWVLIQWLFNIFIVYLRLPGIENLYIYVFKILFAISSLAPVADTIYRNIRIMHLRTQRKIHQEIEIGEVHEPD